MPELPEVETIRRDLAGLLIGKRVASFVVSKPRLLKSPRPLFSRKLVGARFKRVSRRAKLLLFELSSGYTLFIHLKMTGQLVWRSRQGRLRAGGHPIVGVSEVPNRYTYVTIKLNDGSALYFNDVRQFGYLKLVPSGAVEHEFRHLGPEPLSADFSLTIFQRQLARRSRTTIKAALLNQQVVAGIGNIYADESLFAACIRPGRRVSRLSKADALKLRQSIRRVLARAVTSRGTSFSSYRDAHGQEGGYWSRRLVYGRAGSPCRRCGTAIVRTVVAGRGTHYCPKCQK